MSALSHKPSAVANPSYEPQTYAATGYRNFRAFYRRLHLIGTTVSLALFTRAALAFLPLLFTLRSKSAQNKLDVMRFGSEGWKSVVKLLLGGLAQAYVWAWIGHFFYEKNKPATFKHPFYSLLGDLQLWKEIVTLQRQL